MARVNTNRRILAVTIVKSINRRHNVNGNALINHLTMGVLNESDLHRDQTVRRDIGQLRVISNCMTFNNCRHARLRSKTDRATRHRNDHHVIDGMAIRHRTLTDGNINGTRDRYATAYQRHQYVNAGLHARCNRVLQRNVSTRLTRTGQLTNVAKPSRHVR